MMDEAQFRDGAFEREGLEGTATMAKPRLLIVEDEEISARGMSRRLEDLGYTVSATVSTGEEAIRHAGKTRPDLVLMDIRLQGDVDGIEAAARIRADFDIPVIYLTAYADEATLRRAKITEPFGYILKPYEERELWSNIEIALYKHKAERKLRESEEKFRLAMEATEEGLWDWSMKTGQIYCSARCASMLGYEPNEFTGLYTPFDKLVHPDDRLETLRSLQAHLEGKIDSCKSEHRLETKSGEWKWVLVSGKVVERDADGTPVRMVGTNKDISERKRMEEEILEYTEKLEQLVEKRTAHIGELERRRAESEKLAATGRMAASIAHEINNPLGGIKNCLLLVKKALPEDHPRYKYINLIEKEIKRITRIVHTMLDFYRPDQGSVREFSVAETIRDVAALLETSGRQRDVKIVVDAPEVSELVRAPAGHLTQVLLNIVQNGIDASPEGGVVKVALRKNGGFSILTVSDQGSGIPEDVRSRIYEPFFTTKADSDEKGLGLGLTVSKSMVIAMGGSIDFDSKPGCGTEFRITLPLAGAIRGDENG